MPCAPCSLLPCWLSRREACARRKTSRCRSISSGGNRPPGLNRPSPASPATGAVLLRQRFPRGDRAPLRRRQLGRLPIRRIFRSNPPQYRKKIWHRARDCPPENTRGRCAPNVGRLPVDPAHDNPRTLLLHRRTGIKQLPPPQPPLQGVLRVEKRKAKSGKLLIFGAGHATLPAL